ncbi:MAG: hypothetical protein R3F30_00745 [Planctomycetota bacterium]
MRIDKKTGSLLAVGGLGVAVLLATARPQDGKPVQVQLCDGETSVSLPAEPASRAEAQAVADGLMAAWKAKNPERAWVMEQDGQDAQEALLQKRFQLVGPYDNRAMLGEGQAEGHPYRDFTERDVVLWEREVRRLVLEGAQVFHDANRLGSTIAVSCDMCHPDASNTHPETYPKYQTQIGRTVLLRHMINWCIEHPVRGQPLAEDDPRMIALEAYIYAQRKGKTLQYGRH